MGVLGEKEKKSKKNRKEVKDGRKHMLAVSRRFFSSHLPLYLFYTSLVVFPPGPPSAQATSREPMK